MGVATGDFDNDGCVDLYVTSFGTQPTVPQQLQRHVHRRVEGRAARRSAGWSVSAAVLRLRSRRLARSVRRQLSAATALEQNTKCFSPSRRVDYCPPNAYRPQPSRLFHNNRDGTFTDVTAQVRHRRASTARRSASSTADFNGDGWIESTWRTTASRISSGSISTTARSRTWRCVGRRRARPPRARPKRAWASTPATSTTTATRICSSPS